MGSEERIGVDKEGSEESTTKRDIGETDTGGRERERETQDDKR
jgi:hypothetical protein